MDRSAVAADGVPPALARAAGVTRRSCLAVVLALAASGCHTVARYAPQPAANAATVDGAAADGATSDGTTSADGRPDAGALGTRVPGAMLLYLFDEGAGSRVVDHGLVGHDLTIAQLDNVSWRPGTLTIDAAAQIDNATAPTPLIEACRDSGAMTVEAWVTPAIAGPRGPARIVSLGISQDDQSFVLGQGGCNGELDRPIYCARVKTSDGNTVVQGVQSPEGSASTTLSHVVHTFTGPAKSREELHINSVLVAGIARAGDLSVWDPGHLLAVGNQATSFNRPWLGRLHLVAVYCRALSAAEIVQNFQAGADPELAP